MDNEDQSSVAPLRNENGLSTRAQVSTHSGGLSKMNNIKVFVLVSGVLMCAQSALSMYTKSVLTSIERQFQISSSLSGLLVGSFNLGNVLFVVLISKLCSEGSRPRSMAFGSLLVAVGGFLNAVPHSMTPVYDPSDLTNLTSAEWGENNENCQSSDSYTLLFIGEMLQGIGAATLVPLGSSYVDDFAKPGRSPLYIGIMLFLQNMGPGVGYLVGSLMTTYYVDFDKVNLDEVTLQLDDKDWVGAWWLGYIIMGIFVTLSSIPLFFFPKSLPTPSLPLRMINEEESCEQNRNEKDNKRFNNSSVLNLCCDGIGRFVTAKYCNKFTHILKSTYITVRRLLRDPLYVCVVLGYSALMFTVGALTTFMPKFFEIVFYQSKSRASLIFGMSIPVVICVGLVSGGLVIQKAELKTKGKMIFACIVSTVTVLLCTSAYFVTCDLELKNVCLDEENGTKNSSSCSHQREEACASQCYTFSAIVSLAALLACNIITPYYSVILSTVRPEDKSTAIGLKFLIIRVLALIPSPIITGAIIDKACIKWSVPHACMGSSVCLEHDRESFRYSFLNIIFFGVVFTLVFNVFGYFAHRLKQSSPQSSTVNT